MGDTKQHTAVAGGHRRGSVLLLRALLLLLIGLVLYGLIRLLLLLVPIREVVLDEGVALYYTEEEILSAAEISEGGRMYAFRPEKAEEKVLSRLPFLEKLTFSRSLRGTLTVSGNYCSAEYYIRISGKYYILSSNGYRVLAEEDTAERYQNFGLSPIALPGVRSALLGEVLLFGEGSEIEDAQRIEETLSDFFSEGRLSGIDLSDRFDIKVYLDGKHRVSFGGPSELSLKLELLSAILEKKDFDAKYPFSEIDLSVVKTPTVRKIESPPAFYDG